MAITIKAKATVIEDKNEWSLSVDIMLKEPQGNGNVVHGSITEEGIQSTSCGYFCAGDSRTNIYINSAVNGGNIYQLTLNTKSMSLQGQLLKKEESSNPFLCSLATSVVGEIIFHNCEIQKK